MAQPPSCPDDKSPLTSALISFPGLHAEVYVCKQCRGEALDGKQAESLLGRKSIKWENPPLRRPRERRRFCSFCPGRMRQKYARGAFVDVCQSCRSLWFDRYEYETLMHPGSYPIQADVGRRLASGEPASLKPKKDWEGGTSLLGILLARLR